MVARKFTDEQELIICQEYIIGLHGYELAKKYNVYPGTIYRALERNGIKRRLCNEYHCKYNYNRNFFDIIDTENKIYWLGFIVADGHVYNKKHRITIRLGIKDKIQLKKFLKDIEGNNKIYDEKRFNKKYKKFYLTSCLNINSKQMKKALLNHIQNGFSTIPDKFKKDFIRGLFDGDGCIHSAGTRSQFSIIGEPSLIEEIQKYLIKEIRLKKTKLYKPYNTCPVIIMNYSGIKNIKKIYELLYKNAIICMDRKRDIFLEIIS